MKKRRRTNRRLAIVRNLLAAALVLALTWAAVGFPPLSRGMMLRQVCRDNLLNSAEGVWEGVYGEEPSRVLWLRSGTTYLWVCYNPRDWSHWSQLCGTADGILVRPMDDGSGDMLALGDVPEAASATLEWSLLDSAGQPVCTCAAAGTRDESGAFRFAPGEAADEQEQRWRGYLDSRSLPGRQFCYTLRYYDRNGALLREVSGA